MTPSEYMADQAILDAIDAQRVAAGYANDATGELDALAAGLLAIVAGDALGALSRSQREARAAALIDAVYVRIADLIDEREISEVFASKAVQDLEEAFSEPVTMPQTSTEPLEVEGHVLAAWWKRQAEGALFSFAGLYSLSLAEAAPKIFALVQSSASASRALINTATNAAAARGRMSAYAANPGAVGGYQQISILDGRTSDICIDYAGCTWDLDFTPTGKKRRPFQNGCPRHFNCRSVTVPISNPAAVSGDGFDGVETLDHAASTFAQWLASQPDEVVNEALGARNVENYKSGIITQKQLLDVARKPTTLSRLRDKYALTK